MQDALLSALEQGALLLTANRRLARHWRQSFDVARQAAGASVWQAPLIRAWPDWVNESIEALLPDRVTPSDFTERRGWLKIIGDAPLLDRQATASSAAQAWALCQQYRLSLQHPGFAAAEDTARFRDWALAFEQRVAKNHWLPAARRELWLAEAGQLTGREVWLDGFDEVTPAQQQLLARLRTRRYDAPAPPAAAVIRRGYPDARAELEAAACWARTLLEDGAARSVGIVVQNLGALRPAVEAAFEDILGRPLFNISLGLPLTEWPVVADALLWLRWLGAPLEAGSAGVLLRSPFLAGAEQERGSRALFDAQLRAENLLEVTAARARAAAPPLLGEAIGRALTLFRAQPRQLSPGAWARVIPELLAAGGWPGPRPQSSPERQALARWQSLLREFAALDLVEGPVPFSEALSLLASLAAEAIFQPETEEMPVQILEALQASGSRFDALWVMGLTDIQWPPPARPHPFLPRALQRELDLPHATPERELRFARDVTARLVRSAPVVVFSHPHRDGDEELRPSRLIAGYPEEAPPLRTFPGYAIAAPLEDSLDRSAPPLPEGARVRGGAGVLARQSQCPFRAFASVRLRAEEWAEPEPGLSPLERGTALHAALAALWTRFGSRAALARATSAERFAAIREAARTGCAELSRDGRDNLVELERQRVEAVLEDWIELDCERGDFTVEAIEKEVDLRPAGLPLRARADRIDRLPGGERVLIDYKSTAPGRKVWAGERPDNLQLPLYAVALPDTPSAIVFAQMKRGEHKFDGLAADVGLLPGVKPPPQGWQQQLEDWREVINRIWDEFQSGRADVDPKDGGKPCSQCHLHSLCRVYDTSLHPAADDADSANP